MNFNIIKILPFNSCIYAIHISCKQNYLHFSHFTVISISLQVSLVLFAPVAIYLLLISGHYAIYPAIILLSESHSAVDCSERDYRHNIARVHVAQ